MYIANSVYVVGGYKQQESVDSVYHLDLDRLKWHTGPAMLQRQSRPITCSTGSHIYVVFNTYQNETCDPITLQHHACGSTQWTFKSSLPAAVTSTSGAAYVAVERSVFVVGGYDKVSLQYTIDTDSWTILTSPLIGHGLRPVVFHHDKLYLIGGINSSTYVTDIEEYDIKQNKWRIGTVKLPVGLRLYAVAMMPCT